MKKKLIVLLTLIAFFISCKNSENVPEKKETKLAVKTLPEVDANCFDVILDSALYTKTIHEPIRILESEIKGNYLYLKYTYSGCPSDEIYLVWNSMLKKSYPGQASLKLGYETTGSCDEMHTKESCYDLKSFVQYKKVMLYVNNADGVLYDVSDK